ncbi:MAG: hypothetical protein CR217_18605 [Beijerinckiaceae bacterium]|nr:MAG: hypothetical protein CR217_18605 [Beijerinckiaceae bacterium]
MVATFRQPFDLLAKTTAIAARHAAGNTAKRAIDGVRVPAASSCLQRLKPGTALLREYQGERPTVTVVPTGYLWPETAYASPLQFSPPILKHICAIKTKLGTEP